MIIDGLFRDTAVMELPVAPMVAMSTTVERVSIIY